MQLDDAMQARAKALADKSRFRIFRHIVEADDPVGVPELTDLLGFNHNAIRQHLAMLVEAGLVVESTEKRTVRGRPRKQYEARVDALAPFVHVGGSYQRLAELLLDVAASGASPFDVGCASNRSGTAKITADSPVEDLAHLLAVEGFEPALVDDGIIRLDHCPFAEVASQNPGVVCALHHGLVEGHLERAGVAMTSTLDPRDPRDAGCIVTLHEGT